MKPILITLFLLILAPLAAYSQAKCPPMPSGTICLSQAAANAAASNARELAASRAEIEILKQALTEKDKSITELRLAGNQNVADLTKALTDTQVKLAQKTGELIGSDAERTRLIAMLEMALKNTKKKRNAFITLF
jgi:hypothetical protein